MTDEQKNGNGAGEPQVVQMEKQVIMGMAEAIAGFCPPTLPRDQVLALAAQVIAEGAVLGKALDDALYGMESATKYPMWAAVVLSPGEKVQIVGPKRIPFGSEKTSQQNIDSVMCSVTVLALLTSPIARAVLRAHGYDIAFGQKGAPKEASQIVVAKS